MTATLPLIAIQAPKNPDNSDLSDHYPIVMQFSGLKVVSYNVQLMPLIIGGVSGKSNVAEIKTAVTRISDYFLSINADVCCVQELFDNTANELLEKEMIEKGYVATDRVGASALSYTNGGARTFVKKNCANQLSTHQHIYQNTIDYFIGGDATAHKGVVQTCIEKDDLKYHVFNTHLQAYYPNREHYAEITLIQCVELKRFVETQINKGVIGINDSVILCGDFNIPLSNNDQNQPFLFEKMKRILGSKFKFLDYDIRPDGPQHTLSLENSYNKDKVLSSDINIHTDMCLTYNALNRGFSNEVELSDLYCDIQRSISIFVRKNAKIFSGWTISDRKKMELDKFNQAFDLLISSADQLKMKNINPLDDKEWFSRAVNLLKGPGSHLVQDSGEDLSAIDAEEKELKNNSLLRTVEERIPDLSDSKNPLFAEDDNDLDDTDLSEEEHLDINRCKKMFDGLIGKLKKINADIHLDYINSGDKYQNVYKVSLKLNHTLLNEGDKFFREPTWQNFKLFKYWVMSEICEAEKELSNYPGFWSKVNPIIKKILGVFAAISVLPLIFVVAQSKHSYTDTFFSTSSPLIKDIIKEIDVDLKNPKTP
jgi:endonuclease/exonuclease/phosphatase family metal-dependent hydrolase